MTVAGAVDVVMETLDNLQNDKWQILKKWGSGANQMLTIADKGREIICNSPLFTDSISSLTHHI